DDAGNSRIFYCAGPFLHAVDAKTGLPVEAFGVHGRKDLHDGLGADFADLFITNTSPPSVYKNLVISGTRVSEAMDAAPGHIRAYDARTGEIAWTFRTIPLAGEPGSETWDDQEILKWTGGGNNWMGMTIDHARGRSEEHTSELQSRENLVCRLLLEKKKTTNSEIDASELSY